MAEEIKKQDILLVDDRPENLIALEALLDSPDLNIIKATSGNEALGRVLEHDYALILLDVQMPEMDGFEAAKLIRGIEKSKHIPIIFVTAISKEEEYIFKGYQSGAVDYLFKPINPNILKSKVKIFLDLDRQKKLLEERTLELEEVLAELKKTQSQILQAEKMASIGQLAAGVAHEINNPISFVNSNLNTLKGYLKDIENLLRAYKDSEKIISPEALKKIEDIKQAIDLDFLLRDFSPLITESLEGTERVKKIVSDLKDFSHVDQGELKWMDINRGIESTINVVWNELKYKAEVIKELGDLPSVYCFPQQLNQVFMNILINAAQAIEEKGKITITTKAINDKVEIRISDTGSGMPSDIIPKIFDPFFTTKPIGKGTGLGLNISFNIIQKHKGSIEVKSEIGKGSTFIIRLQVEPDLKIDQNQNRRQ